MYLFLRSRDFDRDLRGLRSLDRDRLRSLLRDRFLLLRSLSPLSLSLSLSFSRSLDFPPEELFSEITLRGINPMALLIMTIDKYYISGTPQINISTEQMTELSALPKYNEQSLCFCVFN